MLYQFKPGAAENFAAKTSMNAKIAKILGNMQFELQPCSDHDDNDVCFIAVGPEEKQRLTASTKAQCDFSKLEVEAFLEKVESDSHTKQNDEVTVSDLHNWAIGHAMTDIPISKLIEIYEIYNR